MANQQLSLGLTDSSPCLDSPLYLQILGSTLSNFESLHTQYSEVSNISCDDMKTFLYEYPDYLPFEVTINETFTYMARDTSLPGVYRLIPLHIEPIVDIHQVKIHLDVDMETEYLRIILRRSAGGSALIDVTTKEYYLDNSLVIIKGKE
jgi:hypothetical protein